jgi:VWFA-related protein
MNKNRRFPKRTHHFVTLTCLLLAATPIYGQVPVKGPDEEVVRISAELVQTDVMVFDKGGKFVDNLKPEQFEMRIDGKSQAISFFERVAAGTFDEEAQLAAARGIRRADTLGQAIRPLDRGRVIIFFLDDLHLTPAHLPRTRDSLLQFVDHELGQNDLMAIFTATGQLGFLQQLTGDKTVLRSALKRLAPRNYNIGDGDRTPMTQAQALAIERNDRAVFDFFVDQLLREMNMSTARPRGVGRGRANSGGGGPLAQAEANVKARARNIVIQANAVTKSTLSSLENVVRAAAPLPARKLVVFVSEGFFLDEQSSTIVEDLRSITDAAARSGTVIYTVDSRGLMSGVPDASTKIAFDPNNQLVTVNSGALTATQTPLHVLARDTGGRALLDSNNNVPRLSEAVEETARYYLLAWRPEGGARQGNKFHHIEVSIKDRPDLNVRVRRGFFDEAPQKDSAKSKKDSKSDKKKQIEEELMAALKSLYPRRALPTALSAGYMESPEAGALLTASIEVDGEELGFGAGGGKEPVALDLVGAIVNDEGKSISDFEQNLTITPLEGAQSLRRRIVYNQQLKLTPGLYQVRVAARERRTGRSGSATQWVEVPDFKKAGFTLSSLFVGEVGDDTSQSGQLSLCADHSFARTSRLGFLLYIYNATRGASAAPDVALQVQIFRDDQPVVTRPLFKIDANGAADPTRLSYGEDIALADLPSGRYALQVTAIDRVGKASASRRINFIVR